MPKVGAIFVLLTLAPLARAQSVSVEVGPPPPIRFVTPPPLVEVSPGVQVVPDQEEEVYYIDGYYWARHGNRWYRTRDHRGGWAVVEEREVPETIVVMPRGKYKHYKPGKKGVMIAPDGEVVKYKIKKEKHKKEK